MTKPFSASTRHGMESHCSPLARAVESCSDQCAKEKEDSNLSTSFQSFCQYEMLPAALKSRWVSRVIASLQKQVTDLCMLFLT